MKARQRIAVLFILGFVVLASDVASTTARIAPVPSHTQRGSGLLIFLSAAGNSYYSSPGTVAVLDKAGHVVAVSETWQDQWFLVLARPGTYTLSATATMTEINGTPARELACRTVTATVRAHRQIKVTMPCASPVYHPHPPQRPHPSSPSPPGSGHLHIVLAQEPRCPTVTLNPEPEERPGAEELVGGFYGVGGPARPRGSCPREPVIIAGTHIVTINNAETGAEVASQIVSASQRFAIPLTAGTYTVQASICDNGGPVTFTVFPGETERMNFICPIS